MIDRGNPVSIEAVGALETPSLGEQVKELVGLIRDVDNANSSWVAKQKTMTSMRYGPRKRRNSPWKNASNINVPIIDEIIRRWRPGISGLVLDADPVASFTAQEVSDFEPAREVEPFFTWLFKEYMQTTRQVTRLADLIAMRGHAYTREGWHYETDTETRVLPVKHLFPNGIQAFLEQAQAQAIAENREFDADHEIIKILEAEYNMDRKVPTEGQALLRAAQGIRSGAEYVRLKFRKVVEDRPSWVAVDPINTISPQDQDPETADFFCVIHEFSVPKLKRLVRDGFFPAASVGQIIEAAASRSESRDAGGIETDTIRQQVKDLMNRQAGIESGQTGRARVSTVILWEIFTRLETPEGTEKAVVWWAPDVDMHVMTTPYIMPFDRWPITLYGFSAEASRAMDNRGIAEMLLPFQKIVNAYHNARLDASQIVLSPVMKMRLSGGVNQKSINWHPGGVIPLQNMEDLQPIVHDIRILTQLLVEEQSNRRQAETYVGTFDATLNNLTESRERRTAAEVNAIQQISGNIFGLDAKLFIESIARSFTKIWQLYEDLGPEELFFRVQGEQKPRIARKSEISRRYDIRAAGSPANTNRAFLVSNVERILPLLLNPAIVNTGTIDVAEVINYIVRVIRPPEQAAAIQTILQAAQIQAADQNQEPPPGF
jgi:hypothetical protein